MEGGSDFLIVGAGVYGTSVAASLAAAGRGYSITVLDRSPDGYVAKDGASHDLNKIIRADYSNSPYSRLAKQAISCWRTSKVLAPFYHETGVLFRSGAGATAEARAQEEAYVAAGVRTANDPRDQPLELAASSAHPLPVPAFKLTNDAQLDPAFASSSRAEHKGPGLRGFGGEQTGYLNPRGGWAEANAACRALLTHAKTLGVQTVADCVVNRLVYDSDKVIGVGTVDGRVFYGKTIVLCTGAWTGGLLCELASPTDFNGWWPTRPSAQCVATLRLTEQEAKQLKDTPVVLNFSTGFYLFEPTLALEQNGETSWQMKIAIHSNGYCTPSPCAQYTGTYPSLDQPCTPTHDAHFGTADAAIPPTKLDQLLDELRQVYPHLAQRERVVTTRVCWYSDTLDENWIIDALPSHPNVWTFSGDSGHGYKFLPILGDLFQTVAGLRPNPDNWPLQQFSFAHHKDVHSRQMAKREHQFHPTQPPAQKANLRARL